MKTILFTTCILLALLTWQCTPTNVADPVIPAPVTPTFNYDQASTQLMTELKPQIVGQWRFRQVQLNHQKSSYYPNQIRLTKDTTFQNLATLTIVPAAVPRTNPVDTRRGEYDGTITYKGKSYPVQFDLLASADWLVTKRGPQAFFLFDFRFPNGLRFPEPEEDFLEAIGIVGDNFSMEITDGQPMVWRGLNRGADRVELVRL